MREDQLIAFLHYNSMIGLVLVALVAWAAVVGARYAASRTGHWISMGCVAIIAAIPGYAWVRWALASNAAVRDLGQEYLGILAFMLLVTYACSHFFTAAEEV